MQKLLEEIKEDEGFRASRYICPTGFPSIGYGTRLPLSTHEKALCVNPALLTKQEASLILEYRLKLMIKDLEKREPSTNKLPLEAQSILSNMIYQMGVGGVLKFGDMWKALKVQNYKKASVEMLDSLWFRQMHEADMRDGKDSINRAEKLALKMRAVQNNV